MINKLLDNYKEIYSFKKIIKKFPIKIKIFLSLIPLLCIYLGIKMLKVNYILLQIIVIQFIFVFMFILNKYRDKVIKEILGFNSMLEYNEYRHRQFIKKTKIEEFNDKQLKLLIEYIKQYLDEFKVPYFIKTGSIAVIFIPIWSTYINVLFNKSNMSIIELSMLLVIVLSVIFIIFIVLVNIINLLNDYIYNDYYKLRAIRMILKEEYVNRTTKLI